MKTILALLAIAVFSVQPARSDDPQPQTVKVTIVGAVYKSGSKVFPYGTPLETILNAAGCHEGSGLRKIRIIRKIDEKHVDLIVGQRTDEDRKKPVFHARENDIIIVPDRWFDHTASERPINVTGTFILREEPKPQAD